MPCRYTCNPCQMTQFWPNRPSATDDESQHFALTRHKLRRNVDQQGSRNQNRVKREGLELVQTKCIFDGLSNCERKHPEPRYRAALPIPSESNITWIQNWRIQNCATSHKRRSRLDRPPCVRMADSAAGRFFRRRVRQNRRRGRHSCPRDESRGGSHTRPTLLFLQ